ncbi:DUF1329 domain-containing protein [Cupriavidus sp. CP313]
MKYLATLAVAGVTATIGAHALAAPAAADVARLGKELTPFGAERAGNKDGTIPEWTGGLCKAPAKYKPLNAQGGTPYFDPFGDEKPVHSITASNVAQYASKLDEAQKELFKRYPKTYRVDVYPTHRTACFPDWVYDNTIKRVMSPKLVGDGPGLEEAHAQFPFPIPATGQEAMYNYFTRYFPVYYTGKYATWLVDAAGNKTLSTQGVAHYYFGYWDNSKSKSDQVSAVSNIHVGPPSQAGVMDMRIQWRRMDQRDPTAWFYTPGQRRVRLAPEFTYDTVVSENSGLFLWDEYQGFDGKMDRFDFKLAGKKEMYIPYNVYKYLSTPTEQLLSRNHINPDALRYELHRVWVVEATLKNGVRHVNSKKVFYLDEDSWNIVGYEGYDQAGKLVRAQMFPIWQAYEVPAPININQLIYDFVKQAWALGAAPVEDGFRKSDPLPANYFTSDALSRRGVQ